MRGRALAVFAPFISAKESLDGTNARSLRIGRSYEDEHDVIQRDVVDYVTDTAEAIEWLEDNGYDPNDFDFRLTKAIASYLKRIRGF